MSANNIGRLCRDGIFGSLQIKDQVVLTKERKLQKITEAKIGHLNVKTITVGGESVAIAPPTNGLFAHFSGGEGGGSNPYHFVPVDSESGDFLDAPGKIALETDIEEDLRLQVTPGPNDGQVSYRYKFDPAVGGSDELYIATRTLSTGDTTFLQIGEVSDYSGGVLYNDLDQQRAPIVHDAANNRYIGLYYGEGEGAEGEGEGYTLVSLMSPGTNSIITSGFSGYDNEDATGMTWVGTRLLSCHRDSSDRDLVEWNPTTGLVISQVSWDGTLSFSGTQFLFPTANGGDEWQFGGITYDPESTRVYFLLINGNSRVPRVCGYALAADVFGDGGSLSDNFTITLQRHRLPNSTINGIVWTTEETVV